MHSIHPVHVFKGIKWRTLVALARVHRRRLGDIPFIGITGSWAKTTTKTLLAGILSERYPVASNPGSKNRTEAMAKTILRTKKNEICVQELAADGIGSLDAMIEVFRPTVAVVTIVMRDHYSAFRSKAAIAAEKGKLIAALPPDGTAVLNADDPLVSAMQRLTDARCFTFGTTKGVDLRLTEISAVWPSTLSATVTTGGRDYALHTRLYGAHSATAVMAALATAISMGIEPQKALDTLRRIEAAPRRMQTKIGDDGVAFVLDDIKAPLDGIPAICTFIAEAKAGRKILILGSLSDYPGSSSPKYRRTAKMGLAAADVVMLVGQYAHSGLKGQPADMVNRRLFGFRHLVELNDHLQSWLQPGDLVILKGSKRRDHLERLLIARRDTVVCWRSECGRVTHCQNCDRYQSPFSPVSHELGA